jgi:hypothetical protein
LTISPLSWGTPKDISQNFTCQRALGILQPPTISGFLLWLTAYSL